MGQLKTSSFVSWESFRSRPIPYLLILGVALRLIVLFFFRDGGAFANQILQPAGDQPEYLALAKGLLAGKGWSIEGGGFTELGRAYVYRPPFYPLVLAGFSFLTNGQLGLMSALQLFLTLAYIPLAVFFLRLFTANRSHVALGALLVTCNPYLMHSALFFYADSLFALLLSWGLYYFFAWHRSPDQRNLAIKAGLCLGLASLTRGEAWYMSWILMLCFAVFHFRSAWVKPLGIFLLTFAAVISPWAARNFVHYRAFIPVQRGTIARASIASFSPEWSGSPWPGYETWSQRVFEVQSSLPELQREPYMMHEMLSYFSANPKLFVKSCLLKAAHMWAFWPSASHYGDPAHKTRYQSKWYIVFSVLSFVAFIPFFPLGLIRLWHCDRAILVMSIAVFLSNLGIGVIANPDIRIRVQTHLLFLVIACVGIFYAAGLKLGASRKWIGEAAEAS